MLQIRQAVSQDVPQITQLFHETVTSISPADYTVEETQIWAKSADDVAKWQQKVAHQHFLLAMQDNQLLGFASITQTGDYIDFLYVHPQAQRQGIAQQLYDQLEAYAIEQGVGEVQVDVSITARPFFEKNGFQVFQKQQNPRAHVVLVNFKMSKLLKK